MPTVVSIFCINNRVYLQMKVRQLKLKQPVRKSSGSSVGLTFNQQAVSKNADMAFPAILKYLLAACADLIYSLS